LAVNEGIEPPLLSETTDFQSGTFPLGQFTN